MKPASKFNLFALSSGHSINSLYNRVFAPVLPLIVKDFSLNYAQAGLIVSTYSIASGLFQFPFSFASDYLGRWRTILVFSLLVQSVPVFFYGYSDTFSLFLFFVFLSGIGSSAFHPSAVALITREMPSRRGFCLGLFKSGGDAGSILAPILMGGLAVYFASWRTAAQFYVLPGLIWAALIWFRFQDTPSERKPLRQAAGRTLRDFLANPTLLLLVVLSSCRVMGFRGFMAFLPLLLADVYGFGVGGISGFLTIFFLLGTVGSISFGRLSDSRSRTLIIAVLTVLCAGLMTAIPAVSSWRPAAALILILAFMLTPVQGLVLAMGTELVGEGRRSSVVGLIYTVNEGASAISPIVGGLIAEMLGLQKSFYFFGIIFGVAGILSFFLHRMSGRPGLSA